MILPGEGKQSQEICGSFCGEGGEVEGKETELSSALGIQYTLEGEEAGKAAPKPAPYFTPVISPQGPPAAG